ncbi:MAG: DMT family transporter, partial [Deltaproteobacteria bacterium]|nr:DMT family transporter [Deltaproteobacteria bacterium]
MINIQPQRLGTLLVLMAALGFAGKTILTKLAYRYDIDPLTLLTLRMMMAGTFFLTILAINVKRGFWRVSLTKKEWLIIVVLGLLGYYLSSYLDFLGLYYIDANIGRMILFLYPTLVVVINAGLSRTKVTASTKISLFVCYLGLFLMVLPNLSRPQENFFMGVIYIFFSALTYAIYLVAVDKFFRHKQINFFVSLILGISSICIATHYALARDLSTLIQPLGLYGLVFLMASLSTIIPTYCLSQGLALIGAPRAATLSMVGPIFTLFMGV